MTELMNAMQSETTLSVQLWMTWMVLMFLLSLIFIRSQIQAQRAFLTAIGTAFGAYIVWTMSGNVHLLGIVHLIIWLPLAIYLWKSILSKKARRHDGAHDIAKFYTLKYKTFFYWVCLLFGTIVISLVFDVRDIVLVMTDKK